MNMKSITEFSQPTLQKFLAAKATLTAEGKTPRNYYCNWRIFQNGRR